jgi:NADH-quinone oxidoreductase subunit H
MKRLSGLLPVLLAVVCCWLASGASACSRDAAAPLVRVADLVPREVEPGDRVALVGDGFPPGREARVAFRGTLHRPGERPETSAEIVATGIVTGPEQVEFRFTDALQVAFCRAGDRGVHTTFEGDVEVAFAAAVPGVAPVAGILRHVTFDVRPSAAPSDLERDREGARLLAWVGLQTSAAISGLVVAAVEPGSRADSAGIVTGDRIVSFDGVRVATDGDLVPASGERVANVVLRHADGSTEVARSMAVDGFRRAPPADLLAAVVLALVALAIALLLGGPVQLTTGAYLQRLVSRARGGAIPALRAALRDVLPSAGPLALVDAVAYALIAALPFGQYLVASRLDVGLLFVLAAAILTSCALVSQRSPWEGARAAAQVAVQHVPAAIAVVVVVASTGSLRVQEIAATQGGLPWDWLAFRSPGALVAMVLLVACCRIEPGEPELGAGTLAAHLEGPPATTPRGPWLAAMRRIHRLLIAGLASTLFLGGWLLPGSTPAEQAGHSTLQLLGAAWLLAKVFSTTLAMAWLGRVAPAAAIAERTRGTGLRLLPISLVALLAAAAWTWWSPSRATQQLVSGGLLALTLLAAVMVARQLRYGLLSPAGDGRVNPFL